VLVEQQCKQVKKYLPHLTSVVIKGSNNVEFAKFFADFDKNLQKACFLCIYQYFKAVIFVCIVGPQTGIIATVSDLRRARNDTANSCGRYKNEQCFAVTVYAAPV
jgi:hypothetical protein